jgi:hypothetical protein
MNFFLKIVIVNQQQIMYSTAVALLLEFIIISNIYMYYVYVLYST